jgi:molybdopterin-binding protein
LIVIKGREITTTFASAAVAAVAAAGAVITSGILTYSVVHLKIETLAEVLIHSD